MNAKNLVEGAFRERQRFRRCKDHVNTSGIDKCSVAPRGNLDHQLGRVNAPQHVQRERERPILPSYARARIRGLGRDHVINTKSFNYPLVHALGLANHDEGTSRPSNPWAFRACSAINRGRRMRSFLQLVAFLSAPFADRSSNEPHQSQGHLSTIERAFFEVSIADCGLWRKSEAQLLPSRRQESAAVQRQ